MEVSFCQSSDKLPTSVVNCARKMIVGVGGDLEGALVWCLNSSQVVLRLSQVQCTRQIGKVLPC